MKVGASTREAILFSRFFVAAFIVALTGGMCMTYVFFFQEPYAQVTALEAADLLLDQEIYKEVVARATKDMAEMQEQARQQARLDQDIADRTAKHLLLAQQLADDIQARIVGDAQLSAILAEEILLRTNNDTQFQYRIGNATDILVTLQAFEQFSTDQFMIKMINITDITADILAEISARNAKDMALMTQDTLVETALVLLVSQLNAEIVTRTAKDTLLRNQLDIVVHSLFHTINGQDPVGGQFDLTSLSSSLVITNGLAQNQIFVAAAGIASFQTVPRDSVGNVQFVGGNGITIDYPSANTIRITAVTGAIISPNFARIAVTLAHGANNIYVNSMTRTYTTLRNAQRIDIPVPTFGCVANPDCQIYGFPIGWLCVNPLPSTPYSGCVMASGCTEDRCNDVYGDPWHCRGGACVQDYCTLHIECFVAFNWDGTIFAGPGLCINHRCVTGGWTGDSLPGWYDPGSQYAPETDVTKAYQPISQARNPSSPALCTGCLSPEPGFQHSFNVISTKPPFPAAQFSEGTGCLFPEWDFQHCGFRLPGASQTYIVQMTINIRIRITNYNSGADTRPSAWFRMFMDRGYGFEPMDSEYVTLTESSPVTGYWFYSYITMSTTVIMVSAPAGQEVVGNVIHIGWDGYKMASDENTLRPMSAAWWRASYDVTRIA